MLIVLTAVDVDEDVVRGLRRSPAVAQGLIFGVVVERDGEQLDGNATAGLSW